MTDSACRAILPAYDSQLGFFGVMPTWLFIAWLVPAAFFLTFTYAEGESLGGSWDGWRIAGLAGCLAWPLTLPLLAILARRYFKSTSEAALTDARLRRVASIFTR